MTAAETQGPSRTRTITARVLVVIGVVLVVVSVFANFVKREALDEDSFRQTSQELIANPEIQDQIAATLVDQLYANVDVTAQLQQRLPENLQALAGPLAGLSREALDRAAIELLQRPRVQSLFVASASLAQAEVVRVLEGASPRLETTGGEVVLDLRPLLIRLGDRFGFLGNVEQTLPPDAGRIVILQSDQLETAQNMTQALKVVADWIWVLALAAWAVAIWLVPGRRRRELRAIGIGLVVAGVALLVIRRIAGSYVVDGIVQSDSVRPAVLAFWSILTDGLAAAAWVAVVVGAIATLGMWLTGTGARARRWRGIVGPWLARGAAAWAVFAIVLLLVVWALPIHRFLVAAILIVLACIGFELTRRQVARELVADGPSEPLRLPTPWRREAPPSAPSQVDELERLARLRGDDLITEDEYAAAKARSLQRVAD